MSCLLTRLFDFPIGSQLILLYRALEYCGRRPDRMFLGRDTFLRYLEQLDPRDRWVLEREPRRNLMLGITSNCVVVEDSSQVEEGFVRVEWDA